MPELHDSMVRPEHAEATRKLLEQGGDIRETAVIRPGDHLIVRVEGNLTQAEADQIKQMIRDRLPLLAGATVIRANGLYVFRDEATDG